MQTQQLSHHLHRPTRIGVDLRMGAQQPTSSLLPANLGASKPTWPAPECRSTRAYRQPAHLGDYICYSTRSKAPFLLAAWLQNESSDTPYPIANYVTCANFSISHQHFLATITKVTEPRYYHKVAKDSHWRVDGIRALEQNGTWVLQDLPVGRNPLAANGFTVSNIILMVPFSGIRLDW